MNNYYLWKVGLGFSGMIECPNGYIHVVAETLEDAARIAARWEEDTMDEADPRLRNIISVELIDTVILIDNN